MAVQHHFIVVDAAFAVVVMLIDILLCPFLPKIWLYISTTAWTQTVPFHEAYAYLHCSPGFFLGFKNNS